MPQKPVFYFVDPSLSRQIHKAHTFPDRFGFYQRGIHLFPCLSCKQFGQRLDQ